MSRRQFRGGWTKVDWMDERANIARTSKVYIHDLRQVWIVRDADGKSFRLLILVGGGQPCWTKNIPLRGADWIGPFFFYGLISSVWQLSKFNSRLVVVFGSTGSQRRQYQNC